MMHDESGLLGIAGAAADKAKAGQLIHVFCEQFATLATVQVGDCDYSPRLNACFRQDVATISPYRVIFTFLVGYAQRYKPETALSRSTGSERR